MQGCYVQADSRLGALRIGVEAGAASGVEAFLADAQQMVRVQALHVCRHLCDPRLHGR